MNTYYSPVSYNFAVESSKMPIVFKPKLYKCPKDNFGLKDIDKYKWMKMIGLLLHLLPLSYSIQLGGWIYKR